MLLRNLAGDTQSGKCELACPSTGYYINAVGASCDACSAGCETCSGTTATQCLTCNENFYLNG